MTTKPRELDEPDGPPTEELVELPEPEPPKERGDPWEEPCPVCGLLGCRRHA